MPRITHRRRAQLLEVLGFDLLAQVEAMLRHTRSYQREVQRLRGTFGHGRTPASTPSPDALQQHVARLQTAGSTFRDTVKSIKAAAGMRVRENVARPGDGLVRGRRRALHR